MRSIGGRPVQGADEFAQIDLKRLSHTEPGQQRSACRWLVGISLGAARLQGHKGRPADSRACGEFVVAQTTFVSQAREVETQSIEVWFVGMSHIASSVPEGLQYVMAIHHK